jgi:uncharacterized membrane protein YphA (DoxX/SURF4 family)
MSPISSLTWVFSSVLALVFLVTGLTKALFYQKALKAFQWVEDVPRWLVPIIGVLEILGALGLILPAATGVYPMLTVYAAAGLAVLMLSAGTFHAQRHERDMVAVTMLLMLLAGLVAYGHWTLIAAT